MKSVSKDLPQTVRATVYLWRRMLAYEAAAKRLEVELHRAVGRLSDEEMAMYFEETANDER